MAHPPVQRVTIEMSLPVYEGFVEKCEKTSREYAVLKNGVIFRRSTKDRDSERFVKIDCTLEDANNLLSLANKIYPNAVADISRAITTY
jgi:hypothetical protein